MHKVCAAQAWAIGSVHFEAGPFEGPMEKKKLANESKCNTTLFGVISRLAEVQTGRQF